MQFYEDNMQLEIHVPPHLPEFRIQSCLYDGGGTHLTTDYLALIYRCILIEAWGNLYLKLDIISGGDLQKDFYGEAQSRLQNFDHLYTSKSVILWPITTPNCANIPNLEESGCFFGLISEIHPILQIGRIGKPIPYGNPFHSYYHDYTAIALRCHFKIMHEMGWCWYRYISITQRNCGVV